MVVPSPMTNDQRVVKPPVHYHPPVVASPRVVPVPVKLGPAVVRPGFNTFQPGVFRGRSRVVVASPGAFPMFTSLAFGYRVGKFVRPMPPPLRSYGFGMGAVFRNRPKTSTNDENAEEYAEQYDIEVCEYNISSACTIYRKEF